MKNTEQFYDLKRLGQLSSPERKGLDNNKTEKNPRDKVNFIQNKAQSSMSKLNSFYSSVLHTKHNYPYRPIAAPRHNNALIRRLSD